MKEDVKVLRIKEIMRLFHLTQTAMSAKTGIDQGNLSGILSGRRPCGNGIIDKIALSFPDINREWLLYGEGEMLKSTPAVQQLNTYGDNNYNTGVMHIGSAPARRETQGEVIVVEEVQRPIIPSEWACKPDFDVIEAVFKNPDKVDKSRFIVLDNPVDIWIEVRDDSLVPRAYRGDRLGLLVYPKGKEDPIWGKFHAVDTWSNGIVVRKLYPAEGGYRCVSPNEEFPDLFIARENIISVSRVVYVVRKAL